MLGKRLLLAAIVVLCGIPPAGAATDVINSVERALMPGELSKPHAKYEADCNQCHEFFRKTKQNDLCLKCHDHKNIRKDIENKHGLHGRTPEIRNKDCNACHSEHKGRENNIIILDNQTFNHNFTDFFLQESHATVPCTKCHEKDKKYYEAKSECVDCHKKVEPHQGKLGKQCNSCHRASTWGDFVYDHGKTKFPLKGKHKGVRCSDCHPNEQYINIPKECIGCHKGDDKHKGKNGKECKNCHSEQGWASYKFDHDKDTKFPLDGKHKNVICDQCHKQTDEKRKLKRDCYFCHQFVDAHKGLYGKKCQDCHKTENWSKQKFDHDKTDFKLEGKHEKVRCQSCHPGDLYKDKAKSECYACHKQDDPHAGKQGKRCNDCHNEQGWQKQIAFDHNLTKFPLLGAHAGLTCEECHSSGTFSEVKINCYSCHKQHDKHKLRMGEKCQRCHFSTDWKVWEFDHDKQTKYPLKEAHKGIACERCHKEVVKEDLKISSVCYRCHAHNDIHEGQFGRNCGRCHDTKAFENVNMR